MSLLQLIGFIEHHLAIRLELSALTLDAFASVDALLSLLGSYGAERMSDTHILVAE